MFKSLNDDVFNNINFSISVLNIDGDFIKVDDRLLKLINKNIIVNVSDNKNLDRIFKSVHKEELLINDEECLKINFISVDDLYFLIIIDMSFIIDKYDLSNFSSYSIENSQLPHMWVDSSGKIIYANKISEEISDLKLKDTYVYRISSDTTIDEWNKLWLSLQQNNSVTFLHKYYSKKLDTIFVLKIQCNYFGYNDNGYCQMVIIDITELVETNLKLSKEKEKAKESDRLKTAFLSNMSHEIRTPMNAIVGFSDILNNLSTDDDVKEYTKIIIDNADYLLSLMDNIITVSRIDSEQIKRKSEIFDVLKLLTEIYEKYSNKLSKKNSNIKLLLDTKKSIILNNDQFLVYECICKLLDNSIKFTNTGTINFGYKIIDDIITFYVKDTGIGIDNKHHEIIFDRFRQINKQSDGSGLGLSIFKSYVKILDGSYQIKSVLDNGSYFSFSLCIKTKTPNYNSNIELPATIDKLKNIRIMVVEDLEVNQLLIHDMLIPFDVSIVKCFNGKECISKFFEINDIDIILMDLDMPEMNGYETVKIIRMNDKVIPIIAQTAYSQKEDRERTKKMGFTDFMTKPIHKDELIRILLKYV